jgi:tetratricopeptide (TPR) repeat protein
VSPRFILIASAILLAGNSLPASTWTLAKSEHFEVFSQSSSDAARAALLRFELLRAFFQRQTGLSLDNVTPARIIAFASAKEYEPYRIHAVSDSRYVGTESRDYIVIGDLGAGNSSTASHEFAHLILHSSHLHAPPWFDEGLAEFYSTVQIGESECRLGGDIPGRSQILKRHLWIPLQKLFNLRHDALAEQDRDQAGIFYAESWALADMLFLSPEYGPKFPKFLAAITLGTSSEEAFSSVYGRSLDKVNRDLHAWTANRTIPSVRFDGVVLVPIAVEVSLVSTFETQSMLADLLAVSGEFQRAEAAYGELQKQAPGDPDISAALGTIALRKGDFAEARKQWKQAIDKGVRDATLCYQYAALAGMAWLPENEIRPALERAVALRPDYDDALFSLALIEKNSGKHESAIEHLKAVRIVPRKREFTYWAAMADAFNELGKRDEAKAAAQKAAGFASTDEERTRAAELDYISQTEMTVRFTTDANGRQKMVTTRVPHNTKDFNPFIEPSDDMRQAQGTLREIDCSGKLTRLLVETERGRVKLEIADPSRVQMRNAPSEFTCGPQKPASLVAVDYAASKTGAIDGQVRAIEFR